MRTLRFLFLLAAAAAAQDDPELPADAQTPPSAAAEETDAEANLLLSKTLRRLTNGADWVVRADIRHETKPPPGMAGAAGGVVIVRQAGPGGEAFEGAVEAWQAEDGAVVVTSEEAFPGFALYCGKDGRTLKEATFDEEVPDLEQVRAEMASLADRARLARHLLGAGLAPSRDPETGAVTFRGKVDRNLVKPMREGMAGMVKRVVGTEAELTVSADGELTALKIVVRHSDPLQRVMRGQMKAVRIQIQGGGVPVPVPGGGGDDEADDDDHDAPTGSTTYTFAFGARAPSERAQAFKRKAEAILGR